MSNLDIPTATLEEFGPILIKRGYDWIDVDKLNPVKSDDMDKEPGDNFINKALICEAWMGHHDIKVREDHDKLLNSGRPECDILREYFDELESFMVHSNYRGCPFAQTARAVKGHNEKGIEQKIREHKSEVRRFFQKLCERVIFQPHSIAEAIFLIYTGAMSESNDMMILEPIHSGRDAALTLFEKFLPE